MTITLDAPTVVIEDIDDDFKTEDLWAIMVWNDDVNTFQHVITALIEILQHTLARAEQLTMAVHNTGKAVVGRAAQGRGPGGRPGLPRPQDPGDGRARSERTRGTREAAGMLASCSPRRPGSI